jgi:hypothetical protein
MTTPPFNKRVAASERAVDESKRIMISLLDTFLTVEYTLLAF